MGLLDDTVRKAKEFAELTRWNEIVAEQQVQVNGIYMQIGVKYYEKYVANPEAEFEQLFGELRVANERLAELQQEVRKLKNIIQCPTCGGECDPNLIYCGICGTPLPRNQEFKFCANCGTKQHIGAEFCMDCGFRC